MAGAEKSSRVYLAFGLLVIGSLLFALRPSSRYERRFSDSNDISINNRGEFTLDDHSEGESSLLRSSSRESPADIASASPATPEECRARSMDIKAAAGEAVHVAESIDDAMKVVKSRGEAEPVHYLLVINSRTKRSDIGKEMRKFRQISSTSLLVADIHCCCDEIRGFIGGGKVAIWIPKLHPDTPASLLPGDAFDDALMRHAERTAESLLNTLDASPGNLFSGAARSPDQRLAGARKAFDGKNQVGKGTPDSPFTIERRANLSPKDFYENYLIWGKPVIVTDAVTRWQAHKLWNHEYLSERIPEYDHVFGTLEGKKMTGKKRDRIGYGAQITNPKSMKLVKKHTDTPYFLKPFPDAQTFSQSFFSNRDGGFQGATSHLDRQCGIFSAAHFTGTKRWTLWPFTMSDSVPFPSDPLPTVRPQTKWPLPVYQADLRAGELLIFYPGWWHKTKGMHMEKEDVLSFSSYFKGIVATEFTAELWDTFQSVPKYSTCPGEWKMWMATEKGYEFASADVAA